MSHSTSASCSPTNGGGSASLSQVKMEPTPAKRVNSFPIGDSKASLEKALKATALPPNLVERLRADAQDCSEYRRLCGVEHLRADASLFQAEDLMEVQDMLHLKAPEVDGYPIHRLQSIKQLTLTLPDNLKHYITRVPSIPQLEANDPNSSQCGTSMSCFVCCCRGSRFIKGGDMAAIYDKDEDKYTLQKPGYHTWNSIGVQELDAHTTVVYNQPVRYGYSGFVQITEGWVGRVCVSGVYSFLPEGIWQWNSPEVNFLGCTQAVADGRPVTCGTTGFVIVPDGDICVMKIDTTYRFFPAGLYQWNNPHITFQALVRVDVDQAHVYGPTGFVSISEGNMGIVRIGSQVHFLQQGTFQWNSPNIQFINVLRFEVDKVVQRSATGFVTISEGKIGVMQVGSDFRLLVQGTYVWNSPSVIFHSVVNISNNNTSVALGPYTLVVVPDGYAAVTYNNGVLNVLGGGSDSTCSTYFLSHPKWRFEEMLCLQMQTDKLEGNNLLSKDNVELLMVAMSQWRIQDPVLAATHCAPNMDKIRTTVNDLIRATIARIVAGTAIGAGPVGGAVQSSSSKPVVGNVVDEEGNPVASAAPSAGGDDEMGLAQLMQSEGAAKHMADLSANLNAMGIEVVGVFVPEKRMKNDDIRKEVAKQAVIGIKAEAERAAADAQAYAIVKSSHAKAEADKAQADAKAYSIVKESHAEAEAIELVAKARGTAGTHLGAPDSTSARLALTEASTAAYKDAKITIFSGAPKDMAYMMTPPVVGGSQ